MKKLTTSISRGQIVAWKKIERFDSIRIGANPPSELMRHLSVAATNSMKGFVLYYRQKKRPNHNITSETASFKFDLSRQKDY